MVDTELLAIAEATLQSAGYSSIHSDVRGAEYVAGSDERSVVIVGAYFSVQDLLRLAPDLARVAAEATRELPLRKDAYLILLTAQPAAAEYSESIYSLMYDLQRVRRIVRTGVKVSAIEISRAMRAVLPLPLPRISDAIRDPLSDLSLRLQASGVALQSVEDAMERFALEDDGRSATVENDPVETGTDDD